MTYAFPKINLERGASVVREDGKEFVVDERRGDRVLFKAKDQSDAELISVTDAELAELFSNARIVRMLDQGRRLSTRTLMMHAHLGLKDIPEKHKKIVEQRLAYVQTLDGLPRGERSGKALERHLDETARRIGDRERPCARVVRTWLKRYIDWKRDPAALLPYHAVPRQRARRLDPIVVDLIESVIDEFYLTPLRWTTVRVYQELCEAIRDYVRKNPELRDRLRTLPSIAALRRAIRARDPYLVMAARYGKETADRHFAIKRKGRRYTRPLEAVMVDATRLDLFIMDPETGEARPRPWLIIVIDAFSRMIVGFALSVEPPSAATVLQALRNAMAVKSYVRDVYPYIKRPWPCHGKPEEIIADVGKEVFNTDVVRALREIFTDVTFTAVERPEQKGICERAFSTINMQLIHQLPGTTRSNPRELKKSGRRHDPRREAQYTLEDLRAKLHRYFIEDYPFRVHRELGCTPFDMWKEGVARDPVRPPPPDAQLALLLAKSDERELQHYGINMFGIVYRSDELARLRPRNLEGPNPTVTVKWDPDNIWCIWVLDEARREYIPAYAELEDLVFGMSERQFKYIRAKIRARKKAENPTPEDYYKTACELFADVGERPRVKRALRQFSPLERSTPMPFGANAFAASTGATASDFLDEDPNAPLGPVDPDAHAYPLAERIVSEPSKGPQDEDGDEPAFPTGYAIARTAPPGKPAPATGDWPGSGDRAAAGPRRDTDETGMTSSSSTAVQRKRARRGQPKVGDGQRTARQMKVESDQQSLPRGQLRIWKGGGEA